MIKSYVITTAEIDDGGEALREITEQLASITLLKNSVGLVLAHPEFVSSGVYAQAATAFPFPIAGMTTISHCAGAKVETYMLSVTILTSDDCEFSCCLSGKIPKHGGVGGVPGECYESAAQKLAGEPKMAFLYAPLYDEPYHGKCMAAIDAKSGGKMPIFGAVANDDQSGGTAGTRVLYGNGTYEEQFALILISGAAEPTFYVVSAPDESMVMPRVGVITKADDCRLLEINNVVAAEFLRGAGFPVDEPKNNSGLLSSIFVLHIGSGDECVRVSRIPYGVTENGGILCGGDLTEGAVLSIAFNTREVVLGSANTAIENITHGHSGGTVIMHSCLGRRYGLLSEPLAELELFRKALSGKFSCTASYASGELCPTFVNGNMAGNRFHNQTLIACVL